VKGVGPVDATTKDASHQTKSKKGRKKNLIRKSDGKRDWNPHSTLKKKEQYTLPYIGGIPIKEKAQFPLPKVIAANRGDLLVRREKYLGNWGGSKNRVWDAIPYGRFELVSRGSKWTVGITNIKIFRDLLEKSQAESKKTRKRRGKCPLWRAKRGVGKDKRALEQGMVCAGGGVYYAWCGGFEKNF